MAGTNGHQDFEPTPKLCYAHATDGEGTHYFCMSEPGHAEEHTPTKWRGKVCKYCSKPIYGFDYRMCGILPDGGSEFMHLNPCPVDEAPIGRKTYEDLKAAIEKSFRRIPPDAPISTIPDLADATPEEKTDELLPDGQ